MKYGRLINSSPWIVGITGVVVMFGWIIDSRFLIQIYPSFTSMKFFTAFLFFLLGFQLFEFRNYLIKGTLVKSTFYTNTMLLVSVVIVFCFFVHISPNIFSDVLSLIPISKKYDPWTTIPHIPSILTLLCFSLIQVLQYITLIRKECARKALLAGGTILSCLSWIVLLNYIFDVQWIFLTTLLGGAMAIHSAFLFVVIGINFLLIRKNII